MIDYKLKVKEVTNGVSVNSFVETTEDYKFYEFNINNRRSLFCKQRTECIKNIPNWTQYNHEHTLTLTQIRSLKRLKPNNKHRRLSSLKYHLLIFVSIHQVLYS